MGRVPGFALQADSLIGSSPIFSTKQSVCNVNLVDGLVWNEEAGGSNPPTQTNLYRLRIMDNTLVYEAENIGSIPVGGTNF